MPDWERHRRAMRAAINLTGLLEERGIVRAYQDRVPLPPSFLTRSRREMRAAWEELLETIPAVLHEEATSDE